MTEIAGLPPILSGDVTSDYGLPIIRPGAGNTDDGRTIIRDQLIRLVLDALEESDIPAEIARSSAVATAIGNAIATHLAASNPHPDYVDGSELASAISGAIASNTSIAGGGSVVQNIVSVTSAEYDAIAVKDPSTLYFVV